MLSLRNIRRRIGAVRGTQKVTRAMKLVAAARLKRAQQGALASRPFSCGIYDAALRVSRRLGPRAPMLWRRPREISCVDVIAIFSQRGFCGGFNEGLLHLLEEGVAIAADHAIAARIFAVGRKGERACLARGYDLEVVPAADDAAVASWLLSRLTERFQGGLSAGANILFNRLAGGMHFKPVFWNLLPLHQRGSERERHLEYLYEPERLATLDRLAARAFRQTILQALRESRAAELAARMVAMDNATRNAEEMVAHLTSVYHRARQEAITRELLDIIGGAEALR